MLGTGDVTDRSFCILRSARLIGSAPPYSRGKAGKLRMSENDTSNVQNFVETKKQIVISCGWRQAVRELEDFDSYMGNYNTH